MTYFGRRWLFLGEDDIFWVKMTKNKHLWQHNRLNWPKNDWTKLILQLIELTVSHELHLSATLPWLEWSVSLNSRKSKENFSRLLPTTYVRSKVMFSPVSVILFGGGMWGWGGVEYILSGSCPLEGSGVHPVKVLSGQVRLRGGGVGAERRGRE